jgi:plasmid stabilization system protein ParE
VRPYVRQAAPARAAARRAFAEIGLGLRSLHVGLREQHIILCRQDSEVERVVDVLRILRAAMDLARHIPPQE